LERLLRGELRAMVKTLKASLSVYPTIALLLALVYLIYAIAGVALFQDAEFGEYINEQANFRTVLGTMVLLFRFTTGESWNGMMRELVREPPLCNVCYSFVVVEPYFISFIVVTAFLLINLFVAVVVANFDAEFNNKFENARVKRGNLNTIKKAWSKSTLYPNCELVSFNFLCAFLSGIREEPKFHPERELEKDWEARKLAWQKQREQLGPIFSLISQSDSVQKFIFDLKLPSHQGKAHFADFVTGMIQMIYHDVPPIRGDNQNLQSIRNTMYSRYPILKQNEIYMSTINIYHAIAMVQSRFRGIEYMVREYIRCEKEKYSKRNPTRLKQKDRSKKTSWREQHGKTEPPKGDLRIATLRETVFNKERLYDQVTVTKTVDEVFNHFSSSSSDCSSIVNELVRDALNMLGKSVTDAELDELISTADKDGSGEIDKYEFLELLSLTDQNKLSERELVECFRFLDYDKDDRIDKKELALVLTNIGDRMRKDEVNRLLAFVDINMDGALQYAEFTSFMFNDQQVYVVDEPRSLESELKTAREKVAALPSPPQSAAKSGANLIQAQVKEGIGKKGKEKQEGRSKVSV